MKIIDQINEDDFVYIPDENCIRRVASKGSDHFGDFIMTDHGEYKSTDEIQVLQEYHLDVDGVELSDSTRRELEFDLSLGKVL